MLLDKNTEQKEESECAVNEECGAIGKPVCE